MNLISFLLIAAALLVQSADVVVLPKVLKSAAPEYPAEARRNNISGTVWTKILVDTSGIPQQAVVTKSDHSILEKNSIDASLRYRFTPGTRNGRPEGMWVIMPFKFSLNGEKHRIPVPVRKPDGGKVPDNYNVD